MSTYATTQTTTPNANYISPVAIYQEVESPKNNQMLESGLYESEFVGWYWTKVDSIHHNPQSIADYLLENTKIADKSINDAIEKYFWDF